MSSDLVDFVVDRIAASAIDPDPFPHVIVGGLLPDEFFEEVLRAIPDRRDFEKVDYPGTGFGRSSRAYHDYGLAYRQMHTVDAGPIRQLRDVFAAPEFSEALLEKFRKPLDDGTTPIPAAKHGFFADGARDYATVFDLQADLPGYQIAPHADVAPKIVTFQLYLTRDQTLARFGTLLCEPKDHRALRGRNVFARALARPLNRIPHHALYRMVYRSRLGLTIGLGDLANWYPWSWFNVTKVAEAMPNHFLAFAPNDRSFHAVDLDIPPDVPAQERDVLRGFIRSGRASENWIAPHVSAR
jgi:hypothetical protein